MTRKVSFPLIFRTLTASTVVLLSLAAPPVQSVGQAVAQDEVGGGNGYLSHYHSPYHRGALEKSHHGGGGRYTNPWCDNCDKSTLDYYRWRWSENHQEEEKIKEERVFPTVKTDLKELEGESGDYAIWLGQSTVLIRSGTLTIITDPVFGDIGINGLRTVKRVTPLPVSKDDIPGVDLILISHNHYDHLDKESLRFLIDRDGPTIITGPGYGNLFTSLGASRERQIVLDWWEDISITKTWEGLVFSEPPEGLTKVRVTSLPMQHWSKRTPFDANRSLWAGYMIEGNRGEEGYSYLFLGDTGYFPGFKDINKVFGGVDIAFIPIGSYAPRWFMSTSHLTPEEALQVGIDSGARVMVPIHFGTFDLTDEPLHEPLRRLKEAVTGSTTLLPKVIPLPHGGVIRPEEIP